MLSLDADDAGPIGKALRFLTAFYIVLPTVCLLCVLQPLRRER